MAGETHTVDICDDDLLPPWSTVFDVIEATDTSDWVLVGGLMVQLHARRAGIPPPRVTKDLDLRPGACLPAGAGAVLSAVLTLPPAGRPVRCGSRGALRSRRRACAARRPPHF